MVLGEGVYGEDPAAMVQKSYDEDVTDEFIKPIVITENGAPVATIQAGDSVIFANLPSGPCVRDYAGAAL